MEIRDILKNLREKNNLTQEQQSVYKSPDRRLVAGKQVKHSQIQIH